MASDAGYHRALLVGSIVMAAAALLALRIGDTRKAAPLVMVSTELTSEPAAPRPGNHPAQRYPDK